MKKLLFLLAMVIAPCSMYPGNNWIELLKVNFDTDKEKPEFGKSPETSIEVLVDGDDMYINNNVCEYELQILDEDGVVVYSTVISAGVSQVVLPSTLSGDYEIRFVTDDYYYYGFITL